MILIGIVALIIFGPRKLPQMARKLGQTMADLRRTTNEFKETWEREVNFEEKSKIKNVPPEPIPLENQTVDRDRQIAAESTVVSPEIKEISSSEMEKLLAQEKKESAEKLPPPEEIEKNDKRSWL